MNFIHEYKKKPEGVSIGVGGVPPPPPPPQEVNRNIEKVTMKETDNL